MTIRSPQSATRTEPATTGLFITATDTEVGKTLIAGAIADNLRRTGRRVGVFKPAASGCREVAGELISDDGLFLSACAGGRHEANTVVPQRFAEPLAPNVAAARAGRTVNILGILDAYRRVAVDSDCVVVEGVGGLLCPLSDEFWVTHLAQACQLPVVIVARPDLGTINHTLLTLQAARAAGLRVAGVVVNRCPAAPTDPAVLTNPDQIARRGNVDILAIVPDDPGSSVEGNRLGNAARDAIDAVDWQGLLAGPVDRG